jgi:hypothetical protein
METIRPNLKQPTILTFQWTEENHKKHHPNTGKNTYCCSHLFGFATTDLVYAINEHEANSLDAKQQRTPL